MLARALALLLLLVPAAAFAQGERIRDFSSEVRIARDGALTVVETIKVAAAGEEIRHGIQRDFPTSYRTRFGQRMRVGFKVLAVTRDGHAEPWRLLDRSNGKRIRIGDADTMLDPGDHVFVITYRTDRQIIYGKDHDELYWNATGTGWTFPIDFASVRITLPAAVRFGNRATYTGPQDATAHDAEVWDERPGSIAFRTTRPLGRDEGLTVAVAFPTSVLTDPGEGRRAGWWLQDWGALVAGALAVIALLGYQVRAWLTAGRGPRAGPVVPLFAPPDGLSAAATRYVSRMGFDNRAFSAAIVELGVRRQLHIDKQDGGWFARDTTTLRRTPGGTAPPSPEAAMLAALFANGDTLDLKQENHETLQTARTALNEGLKAAYLGPFFLRHLDYAVFGLAAIPVAMFAVTLVALLVQPDLSMVGFGMPLLGLVMVATAFGLWQLTKRTTGCVLAFAWVAVFVAAGLTMFLVFGSLVTALQFGAWPILLPLITLPVSLLAFAWMAAPTPAGRVAMDRIAGFKHYLGITEEDRLNTLNPPDKTPELFERYLPYAIALGVENRWADRFAGVLAAASATGQSGTALGWYSGQGNIWDDPGGFASSVGDSLASTVSAASASPSSSGGGSDGGGSSGGGGGGGGGSGW